MVKFNLGALALTGALVWGACLFFVGLGYAIWPPYGEAFLKAMASIYPGYHVGQGWSAVAVGTMYAAVDGAVCGFVLGWLYNGIAAKREK